MEGKRETERKRETKTGTVRESERVRERDNKMYVNTLGSYIHLCGKQREINRKVTNDT